MDASDVPVWAQQFCAVAGAVGVAAVAMFKERRKSKRVPDDESDDGHPARVLAASMVDTRIIRDATEGLTAMRREIISFREQQHDDSRALRTVFEDLVTEVRRNTAALGQGAVTPADLMRLVAELRKVP